MSGGWAGAGLAGEGVPAGWQKAMWLFLQPFITECFLNAYYVPVEIWGMPIDSDSSRWLIMAGRCAR